MNENNMQRVHMIVTGTVQGVGFRSWTRKQARTLLLTGWVTNREDGTVEIVAEGKKADLLQFVSRCQHGPEVSWVEQVQTEWIRPSGEFSEFSVV